MLIAIVIILAILWFIGYIPISGISVPNLVLFTINNHPITLWKILILLVVGWAIGILPGPFKIVASILLLLWILSILGIFAIGGFSGVIVLVIIVGLIISIFV